MHVLRKLTCLTLKIDQICADIGGLQELLLEKREKESVAQSEPLYEFPIHTVEGFENFLGVKQNYENFVSRIAFNY